MSGKDLEARQVIQEEEYDYPYHYIPAWEDGRFSQVAHWSWGYRYLGGIQVVLDQLQAGEFGSLVDIGCGDGRFLREAARMFPSVELLGIDYSERAIGLARALNPELRFEATDVIDDPLEDRFDVATCIETLEHIPPERVPEFCEALAGSVRARGRLVLTVPHTNKGLNAKHYQHFDSNHLRKLLDPYFGQIAFVPFDPRSRLMSVLQRLMGGAGGSFVLTDRRVTSWFYRLYRRRYLYARSEAECWRIAAVCVRR